MPLRNRSNSRNGVKDDKSSTGHAYSTDKLISKHANSTRKSLTKIYSGELGKKKK
jgi:hypothetical protein